MTALTVTPDFTKKTAKVVGKVAAGEHVALTILNAATLYTAGETTLFFRLMVGPHTIAQFPQPVDEGETPDAWSTSGTSLLCTLNLNTVQALKYANAPCNEVLAVFEELGDSTLSKDPTLYFVKDFTIGGWPQKRLTDEPFNLDAYPGLISTWQTQISNIAASVTQTASGAVISITDKNGTTTTATVSNGAQGPSGAKGDKGDKGDAGATGATGPTGPTGATGAQGAQGVGVSSVQFWRTEADGSNSYYIHLTNGTSYVFTAPRGAKGEDMTTKVLTGKTFARPATARGWYDLLAYVVYSLGGNINIGGITPGTAPTSITMTATDGTTQSLRIVKTDDEYTTEVY